MLLTRSMSRQLRSVLLREKCQAKSCTHTAACAPMPTLFNARCEIGLLTLGRAAYRAPSGLTSRRCTLCGTRARLRTSSQHCNRSCNYTAGKAGDVEVHMDGRGAAQAHFVVFRPRARANRKRHACSPPNLHHSVRCVASSVRPSSSSRGKQRHHSLSQHLECSWSAENAAELGPKLPDRCLLSRLYGCHETPSVERRAPYGNRSIPHAYT